jgi:uncharacterized protein involved in exopolysaccharide biosynthesis
VRLGGATLPIQDSLWMLRSGCLIIFATTVVAVAAAVAITILTTRLYQAQPAIKRQRQESSGRGSDHGLKGAQYQPLGL